MTQAYPLQWPAGKPRTAYPARARFSDRATVDSATRSLRAELTRLKASHVVISTNIVLRQDGNPYSGRRPPEDKIQAKLDEAR